MTEQKNISVALAAAQKNFKKPKKSAENSHFKNKYSTLEDDIDAVRDALWAEGVFYRFQMEISDTGDERVTTILEHAGTGTSVSTSIPLLLGKRDMQSLKSATTYARRVGIEFITGIAPTDDDDADTERAGNTMGAAIADAWRQSVEDQIPAGASPLIRARAYADAIIDGFKAKNGTKALSNEWGRRVKLIEPMEDRFPDLHMKIVEAYEARVIDLESMKSPHAAE